MAGHVRHVLLHIQWSVSSSRSTSICKGIAEEKPVFISMADPDAKVQILLDARNEGRRDLLSFQSCTHFLTPLLQPTTD